MIVLTLPYPLSANKYWRPVHVGNHVTIVPTKDAKEFRQLVAALARSAGIRTPIAGRVEACLQLFPHRPLDWQKRMRQHGDAWDDTVQCIDLTNAEKVLLDALNGVVFEDDKRIWKYAAERMEPDEHGARAVLYVRALPPRPAKTVQGDLLEADSISPAEVESRREFEAWRERMSELDAEHLAWMAWRAAKERDLQGEAA